MYQALYRKYRPLCFDDVIGQEHIVETLKNQILENKISHAYLFTGTRGTGKTTCAKILARAVNCNNTVGGDPCNECLVCKGILNGSILDVYEIDAASNNGVDNIRELREDVMFTPASSKYKVYIIDEVHMLSNAAFNALLKTLEEPPSHIIFVFATTEIHKVPQTILSRCQRFDFKRINSDDIKKRLLYIAEKENIVLDDGAADLISRLADGAMRDALSILDRCLSGSQEITISTVEQTVGLCPYEQILDALDAIARDDTDKILKFYSECRKNSKDAASLFSELCSYYRDMIIIKISKQPKELLNFDNNKLDMLSLVAQKYTLEKIIRCVNILQAGITDIAKYKDKHIMAEMALIKLTNSKLGADYDDLSARISKLELLGVSAMPNTALKTKVEKKETVDTKTPVTKSSSSGAKCDFWKKTIEIMNALGEHSAAAIMNTVESTVNGDTLTIHCQNDFSRSVLSNANTVSSIKEAVERATGQTYIIEFSDNKPVNKKDDDAFFSLLNDANDILYKE